MAKEFKKYISHEIAKKNGCFGCCQNLENQPHILSDYPTGKYQVKCPKCGMSTWYDIKED